MSSEEAQKKPIEVRKACLVLGFSASELSAQTISAALDKQIKAANKDAELGTKQSDRMLEIRQASETLLLWLAQQGPRHPNPTGPAKAAMNRRSHRP